MLGDRSSALLKQRRETFVNIIAEEGTHNALLRALAEIW